ncbi:MAG: potassium channel family protein [Nitrospirales bacterium]
MRHSSQAWRDLFLLLSLLLVIVLYPMLDRSEVRRLVLGGLMFAPLLLATVRMAQIKGWVWPTVLLMTAVVISTAASTLFPSPTFIGLKWGILAAFFGLSVIALFSYLKNARTIDDGHLYTAVSIYLLLGMQWFAIYSAIDVLSPGSIQRSAAVAADRHAELLYFSLITLSTIGYGDVVPLHGEARMLAALEGIAGVLYVAITVALLVSAYRPRPDSG